MFVAKIKCYEKHALSELLIFDGPKKAVLIFDI